MDYLEGFVGVCVDAGMSVPVTQTLVKQAQEHELMDRDEDYQEGFVSTCKQASGLDGMFSAAPKPVGDGVLGAGLGALVGVGLGGAALLRPSIGIKALGRAGQKALTFSLNPRSINFLNRGALRNTGSKTWTRVNNKLRVAGMPPTSTIMKPWKENWAKYQMRHLMGPGNTVLAGAGLGGAAIGGVGNSMSGLLPATGYGVGMPGEDYWMPSYMDDVPSGAAGRERGGSSRRPVWESGVGVSTDLGAGGSAGVRSTYANTRSPEADRIDYQIAQLERGTNHGGGIDGALSDNNVAGRIRELQKRKSEVLSSAARSTGGLREDQARAGGSIAAKLEDVERAIRARETNATDASQWLANSNSPGIGGVLRRGWNNLTGYDSGASQLSAELRQLKELRQRLHQRQSQVNNII